MGEKADVTLTDEAGPSNSRNLRCMIPNRVSALYKLWVVYDALCGTGLEGL